MAYLLATEYRDEESKEEFDLALQAEPTSPEDEVPIDAGPRPAAEIRDSIATARSLADSIGGEVVIVE